MFGLGTTGRRVLSAVAALAAFWGVQAATSAWRESERMSTCTEGVAPLYASAGASAGRIAGFVCEELTRDAARGALLRASPDSDPVALRVAGVLRLHPSDVGELLALRRALVDASPEACAALWAGGDGAAEARGLALLSDDELRRFARTVRAVAASAGSTREPYTTVEEAEARFDDLLDELIADGGDDVARALETGEAEADRERACAATRAILLAIEAMPPQDRAVAARAWFVIELGVEAPGPSAP